MASSLTPLPPGATPPEPVNILLVDDQPGRLLTYRAILEPLGEHLVDAASGEEALRLLMEDEYAVFLLDVNMPGLDGFETASLIHQHPRFERVPIIFVTAVNVTDMDRLRGYKLGAVDYVMVPVIPEILRSRSMSVTLTAVTKMIGVFSKRGCWWIMLAVSKPSMPGMFTSSRMSANSSSISRCSASMPDLASTRRSPSGSRIARYVSNRPGWSSTSRMLTGAGCSPPAGTGVSDATTGATLRAAGR